MSFSKFLIFNWKKEPSFPTRNSLTNHQNLLDDSWHFFLACSHRLWAYYASSNLAIIGQNFSYLPFKKYYSLAKKGLEEQDLIGLLFNHPQNHFPFAQQQLLVNLCEQSNGKIFYCLGKKLDFAQTNETNLAIILRELKKYRTFFSNRLPITPIFILEPLNSSLSVFARLKYLNLLVNFIKQWWKKHFSDTPIVLFGGGITVKNSSLLPFLDGFIIGRNSMDKGKIAKWGALANV